MMPLKRGTQIVYVPPHAHGDIHHQDCETGFVVSVRGHAAFCRYWQRIPPCDLRTKANSELTPLDCIVVLEKYCREDRRPTEPPYFHWDTDFLAHFWNG